MSQDLLCTPESPEEYLSVIDPFHEVVVEIIRVLPKRNPRTKKYDGLPVQIILQKIPTQLHSKTSQFLEHFENFDTIFSYGGTLIVKPWSRRYEEIKGWRYEVHAWNWSPRKDPPRWVMMPKESLLPPSHFKS